MGKQFPIKVRPEDFKEFPVKIEIAPILNISVDDNPDEALQELVERTKNPSESDREHIEMIREYWNLFEKESSQVKRDDALAAINDLNAAHATWNLNEMKPGAVTESNFVSSQFITFYYDTAENATAIKNVLRKEPFVQCCFIDHLKSGLIVILRLAEAMDDYAAYDELFSYFVSILYQKYNIVPVNLDLPLASFYLSFDPNIYLNLNSDRISELDIDRTEGGQ